MNMSANAILGVILIIVAITGGAMLILGPPPPSQRSERVMRGDLRIRPGMIEINKEFIRLLDAPQIVNVGSAVNAGDGDTLFSAEEKIVENLKRMRPQKVD